jgi:hypothetical protein
MLSSLPLGICCRFSCIALGLFLFMECDKISQVKWKDSFTATDSCCIQKGVSFNFERFCQITKYISFKFDFSDYKWCSVFLVISVRHLCLIL